LEEELGGIHPIYDCPDCGVTYVYNGDALGPPAYEIWADRQAAIDAYGAEPKKTT